MKLFYSELLKISYSKLFKIVLLLIFIVQPFFAYLGTKAVLEFGLQATPENTPILAEAIPPIEYLGFDAVMLGLMPMIILGAVYGGSEFKNHQLRTTLLANSNKKSLYFLKLMTLTVLSAILSFLSIIVTIEVTHVTLGNLALSVLLSFKVWYFILLATLAWTSLTILSYFMAFLFRTAIVSLLFLIPQVYNVGEFLSTHFEWGKILPVALGNSFIASSETRCSPHPFWTATLLFLWVFIFGLIAYFQFKKRDVGGKF